MQFNANPVSFICLTVVLNEIEERRQFLRDMAALGQEKQYISIINSEISQMNKQFMLLKEVLLLNVCYIIKLTDTPVAIETSA